MGQYDSAWKYYHRIAPVINAANGAAYSNFMYALSSLYLAQGKKDSSVLSLYQLAKTSKDVNTCLNIANSNYEGGRYTIALDLFYRADSIITVEVKVSVENPFYDMIYKKKIADVNYHIAAILDRTNKRSDDSTHIKSYYLKAQQNGYVLPEDVKEKYDL